MPLTIASWNVNSIRARLDNVTAWLKACPADVVCLQEIKATDETFPFEAMTQAGFHAEIVGQKSYNGVAILSRAPVDEVILRALPGDDDDGQARYLEVLYQGVQIACLYLPNGNPMPGDKYDYKLAWMQRLAARMAHVLQTERPAVFCGDYNIIPENEDCHDPKVWMGDALFALDSRLAFQRLVNLGYYDAFRAQTSGGDHYTYWDYQRGAYAKNHGIRIDHHLVSPQALDRLDRCWIDADPRGRDKASDHTPILLRLKDASC